MATEEAQKEQQQLDVDSLRAAAQEYGYDEWYYCNRYRQVVAFSKEQDDLIKIQVYPQTQAMSVCIFENADEQDRQHGDLFTTNKKMLYMAQPVLTLETAREIFASPLEYGKKLRLCYTRHDNAGEEWSPPVPPDTPNYCAHCHCNDKELKACTRCKSVLYCGRDCQRHHWKAQHRWECTLHRQCDAALRWYHVAVASGLTANAQELEQMKRLCCHFDHVLFEPDGPPCLCRGRYGCGSVCTLANMLLQVAREHHDVVGFCSIGQAMARFRGLQESIDDYYAFFPVCSNQDDFMDEFGDEVAKLRCEFVALRPALRSEMLQFQFERIRCAQKITLIDSNEMPLFSMEVTFPIHFCNRDYSRLVFGDNAEEYMCFMHGTFYSGQHDSGSDDDDDDDRTEATTSTNNDSESETLD